MKTLKKAHDAGITFYDTARGYTDSKEKLSISLSDVREKIINIPKTHAYNYDNVIKGLETRSTT